MNIRVTLKLHNGSLQTGFGAILQMGEEGAAPSVELSANLPAAPKLIVSYQRWQKIYREQAQLRAARIQAHTSFATNVSFIADTSEISNHLAETFNQWLRSEPFRPIRDKLLERLAPSQTVQLVLQTQDNTVQRFPWHQWELCDRFPNLEIALSAPAYELTAAASFPLREQVRILAILGSSKGINIQTDQDLLSHLPNADVHYLIEPDRPTLNERIWDVQGWDILFFAGHSNTQIAGDAQTEARTATQTANQSATQSASIGKLYITPTDTLTIPELKYALSKAVARGLKIAIFNSCDGLGLAQSLADLHLSQVLVMRELVPDRVAHTFLQSFLSAFSRGEPLYLAVREAREKLQGLESQFPCASWLPIIYQNPAERSPAWQSLYRSSVAVTEHSDGPQQNRLQQTNEPNSTTSGGTQSSDPKNTPRSLLAHALIALTVITMNALGLFQGLELKVFNQLMRLRPLEGSDPRLLVVTVTAADVQAQSTEERNGSLSDRALSSALAQLTPMEPRAIGLDIYRDFPVRADQPGLASALANTDNLFAVCKSSSEDVNESGINPPPEVPVTRVGFSDFVEDSDSTVRRQLLYMQPEPASPCQSAYSFSSLLALNYLSAEGMELTPAADGTLQLGQTTLTPLEPGDGGYQNIDAWGYQLLLNYRSLENPADIAEQVTLSELLEGKVNAEAVRDRIVLIGTVDPSFKDYWQTPYSRSTAVDEKTYGVFMQAQMVSHLLGAVLDNRPLLKTYPEWSEWLWILFAAATGSLIILQSRRQCNNSGRKLLSALLLTEVGLFGLCWVLFVKAHYWVPWVPAAIAPIAIAAVDRVQSRNNQTFQRQSQDT